MKIHDFGLQTGFRTDFKKSFKNRFRHEIQNRVQYRFYAGFDALAAAFWVFIVLLGDGCQDRVVAYNCVTLV